MTPPTKKMLAEKIQRNRKRLWDWYYEHSRQAPPPFYCSIDLRDSGYKIVPVDSNLYPAGFNNICPDDTRTASPVLRAQIEAWAANKKLEVPGKILVIPESHTTNQYYIENIYFLLGVIREAGFEVKLGWYGPIPEGTTGAIELTSASGKKLQAHPLKIEGGQASAGGFIPDLILLNNDFSSGYPKPLDEVSQPILPSHRLGWHTRKKTEHFRYYNQLATEFAEILEIDPWIIQIDTEEVGPVNFNEDMGTEEVARSVERILQRTSAAYQRHGVEQKPFVFVKNNSGTYGMGITVVHDAEEIRKMNRRTKNKMSVGKNKAPIASVCVQEGVPTTTLVDRLAAEPVIYLFGCELIGGFLRTNTERGTEENLNSQGMVFKKLCMSDLRTPESDPDYDPKDVPQLELVYGAIARISALATGMELAAHGRPGTGVLLPEE
ncbi:MAG: glutamate--cysteine ligase [Bdellovibrionota bacterium]